MLRTLAALGISALVVMPAEATFRSGSESSHHMQSVSALPEDKDRFEKGYNKLNPLMKQFYWWSFFVGIDYCSPGRLKPDAWDKLERIGMLTQENRAMFDSMEGSMDKVKRLIVESGKKQGKAGDCKTFMEAVKPSPFTY